MSKLPQLTKKEKAELAGKLADELVASELMALKVATPVHHNSPVILSTGHSFKTKYTQEEIDQMNAEISQLHLPTTTNEQISATAHKTIAYSRSVLDEARQVHGELSRYYSSGVDSVTSEARQTEAALANAYGAPRNFIDAILSGEHKKGNVQGK